MPPYIYVIILLLLIAGAVAVTKSKKPHVCPTSAPCPTCSPCLCPMCEACPTSAPCPTCAACPTNAPCPTSLLTTENLSLSFEDGSKLTLPSYFMMKRDGAKTIQLNFTRTPIKGGEFFDISVDPNANASVKFNSLLSKDGKNYMGIGKFSRVKGQPAVGNKYIGKWQGPFNNTITVASPDNKKYTFGDDRNGMSFIADETTPTNISISPTDPAVVSKNVPSNAKLIYVDEIDSLILAVPIVVS